MVSPKLYSFFQYFFGSCPVCAQSCRRCTLIFLKIAYDIRVFHLRASYLPDDRTLVVFFLLPDDTLHFGTDVSVAPFFPLLRAPQPRAERVLVLRYFFRRALLLFCG